VKYVLLFAETEQYVRDFEALSEEQRAEAFVAAGRWFAEHADKIRVASRLEGPHTATTFRADAAAPVITNGPFVEGKEIVSGIAEVEAADLDEVLRMVRTWPGCPVIEIRPVAFSTVEP
jgi:hypothetical protein